MGVNSYNVIRKNIEQGLATADGKRKKPNDNMRRGTARKIKTTCTTLAPGLVTVQPMYVNALLKDALAKAAEGTVPQTTVGIQTQRTLSRTPANVSGMQRQILQLTSGVVACCR